MKDYEKKEYETNSPLTRYATKSIGKRLEDVRTPYGLFKQLDQEFNFQLDPCSSTSKPNNLGTPNYFVHPETDGLQQKWSQYKSVYVNPPFGNCEGWTQKSYHESLKECTVVTMVPVRTDTNWWHDWALKADEIRFVRGRVKFEGYPNGFIIVALSGLRGLLNLSIKYLWCTCSGWFLIH